MFLNMGYTRQQIFITNTFCLVYSSRCKKTGNFFWLSPTQMPPKTKKTKKQDEDDDNEEVEEDGPEEQVQGKQETLHVFAKLNNDVIIEIIKFLPLPHYFKMKRLNKEICVALTNALRDGTIKNLNLLHIPSTQVANPILLSCKNLKQLILHECMREAFQFDNPYSIAKFASTLEVIGFYCHIFKNMQNVIFNNVHTVYAFNVHTDYNIKENASFNEMFPNCKNVYYIFNTARRQKYLFQGTTNGITFKIVEHSKAKITKVANADFLMT